MNKATFKKYFRFIIKRNSFIKEEERISVLAKVISAAVRQPQVILEPFFSKIFNYTREDFLDPVGAQKELRLTLRERLVSEGTFDINFDILLIATKRALYNLGLSEGMFSVATAHEAVHSLPTNTSSGYPDFYRPKGQLVPKIFGQMADIITNSKFELISSNHVCYESWRTQERQSGTKFRIFLIFPMLTNAFEMMFMRPILDHYSKEPNLRSPEISYSFHSDYSEMFSIWNDVQKYSLIVGIDYSQFDSTISQKMIVWGLRTIKSLFKMEWWQAKIFDELVNIHTNSIVISSNDGVPTFYRKKSGILSGSVFTNFLGTLVNAIMVEYCLYLQGIKPKLVRKKFKGDDTIIATSENLNVNRLILDLYSHFGAIIKPEACQVFKPGDYIFYLGYFFNNNSKYASSTDLLKRKMVISGRFLPETFISTEMRILSKAVSILSNVTNGYDIFFSEIWEKFKTVYKVDKLPDYYYDLTEREKGVTYTRRNILYDLKYGWAIK